MKQIFLRSHFLLSISLFLICVSAVLMMLAATQVELLDHDETIYALVALDLMAGKMPYEGVFDHKPIAVYYLYAAIFSLFGEEFTSIRLMSILLLLGTATNILIGLSQHKISILARLAAVAFLLSFPIGLSGLAGNTEIMQNFVLSLIFLMVCLVWGRTSEAKTHLVFLFFGVLVAVAFSINYLFSFLALSAYIAYMTSLAYIGEMRVWYLFQKSALIFLGFCLGMILVYSPYLIDHLKGGSLLKNYLMDQQIFLSGYAYDLNKQRIIDRFFVWVVPFAAVLVVGSFSYVKEKDIKFFFNIFAAATFLAAIIAALTSRSFFHHYWILAAVPLSLFAALAVEKSLNEKIALNVVCYSLCGALFLYMLNGSERIVNHYLDNAEGKELHNALDFIRDAIPENGRVAIIHASPSYVFLNKLSVDQKYIFPNHVPKLESNGVLDGDDHYVNILLSGKDFALVQPNFCSGENLAKYIQTCDYLNRNFKALASFGGYNPVTVHQRLTLN